MVASLANAESPTRKSDLRRGNDKVVILCTFYIRRRTRKIQTETQMALLKVSHLPYSISLGSIGSTTRVILVVAPIPVGDTRTKVILVSGLSEAYFLASDDLRRRYPPDVSLRS